MPDLKILKQLVRLMQEADLTELDIEQEGEKIKLKRGSAPAGAVYNAVPVAAPVATLSPAPAPQAATPAAPAAAVAEAVGPTINSPMVGTYYSAGSPDAKPFVNVGDKVGPDTVVCIIEAMKVFNEIKAETSGTVQKVLVQNGQAVEFGQPLFVIK